MSENLNRTTFSVNDPTQILIISGIYFIYWRIRLQNVKHNSQHMQVSSQMDCISRVD